MANISESHTEARRFDQLPERIPLAATVPEKDTSPVPDLSGGITDAERALYWPCT
ncbi:hypothetical protein JOF53_000347 [Crossiella equi]|uniref:Uncharacterized protein n=1 Tax=Crossiella equi TaxID=130796 RepID=A0ABS5A6Y7_9PSEU|nr:hypothetical protein [Crossiella equi]MBP2471475.1 hypothetical protein [Crossiella equi]